MAGEDMRANIRLDRNGIIMRNGGNVNDLWRDGDTGDTGDRLTRWQDDQGDEVQWTRNDRGPHSPN